jgi:hypothetical protein
MMKPGKYELRVVVVDQAGNRAEREFTFEVILE